MTISESDTPRTPGWGADSDPENRPGVPFELTPRQPAGNAHWTTPERQLSTEPPAALSRPRPTPVYSSAQPPRGLSGAIRRAAYAVPPYRAKRWMLLLVADRVDVLEHNVRPLAKIAAGAALIWLGVRLTRSLRA